MKKQIRRGIFETNSSSTHSLTMCKKDTYDAWSKGELFLLKCKDQFLNLEEAKVYLKKFLNEEYHLDKDVLFDDALESWLYDIQELKAFFIDCNITAWIDFNEIPLNKDNFWAVHYAFDDFYKEYKTDTDTIVAFGYYGYDY